MNLFRIFLPFSIILCFFSGCVIYPELVERGVNAPMSGRCGDCHREVYGEWKESPHAESYISRAFEEETNGYRFTFCIGCHAPETIFTDGKIEPRTVNLTEGVNCNSCHLSEDCALSGPLPGHGPHPIDQENLFFRTSELCGKCHAGIYRMWKESDNEDEKKTCQGCHMPSINRKLIQDEPWQRIYPNRSGRQHLFSYKPLVKRMDEFLRVSFKTVTYSSGILKGVLELENTGVPHSIPAGDYGYREILVLIELQDAGGMTKGVKKESLFVETGTALQYRKKKTIPFRFKHEENTFKIKATVIRTSFNRDLNTVLAEKTYAKVKE